MTASAETPNEETPSLVRADMMEGYLGQFNKMFDEEKEPIGGELMLKTIELYKKRIF
jgi:hypothetical protein